MRWSCERTFDWTTIIFWFGNNSKQPHHCCMKYADQITWVKQYYYDRIRVIFLFSIHSFGSSIFLHLHLSTYEHSLYALMHWKWSHFVNSHMIWRPAPKESHINLDTIENQTRNTFFKSRRKNEASWKKRKKQTMTQTNKQTKPSIFENNFHSASRLVLRINYVVIICVHKCKACLYQLIHIFVLRLSMQRQFNMKAGNSSPLSLSLPLSLLFSATNADMISSCLRIWPSHVTRTHFRAWRIIDGKVGTKKQNKKKNQTNSLRSMNLWQWKNCEIEWRLKCNWHSMNYNVFRLKKDGPRAICILTRIGMASRHLLYSNFRFFSSSKNLNFYLSIRENVIRHVTSDLLLAKQIVLRHQNYRFVFTR